MGVDRPGGQRQRERPQQPPFHFQGKGREAVRSAECGMRNVRPRFVPHSAFRTPHSAFRGRYFPCLAGAMQGGGDATAEGGGLSDEGDEHLVGVDLFRDGGADAVEHGKVAQARLGLRRLLPRAAGQLAGQHSDEDKDAEGKPVAGLLDGERERRAEQEEVPGERLSSAARIAGPTPARVALKTTASR